jgi:hypothetical protein
MYKRPARAEKSIPWQNASKRRAHNRIDTVNVFRNFPGVDAWRAQDKSQRTVSITPELSLFFSPKRMSLQITIPLYGLISA